MEIQINARNVKASDSLRAQAAFRMERLQRLEQRITSATITFEVDGTTKRAEARLNAAGGPPVIAEGNGATLRNALDAAMDRIERQLKRRRQRRRDSRTRAVRGRAGGLVG